MSVCLGNGSVFPCFASADLAQIVDNVRIPLTWRRKVLIALDVINGIASLHEQELIHRDIKTDNVLVSRAFLLLIFVFVAPAPSCHTRVPVSVCRWTLTGAVSCATTASLAKALVPVRFGR